MIKAILQILFPPHCISCKKEGSLLCADCREAIIYNPQIIEGKFLDKVLILCKPNKLLRRIVHNFKYRYKEELISLLANFYTQGCDYFPDKGNCFFVPIPIHYSRYVERGFNQSNLIARSASNSLGIQSLSILEKIKKTNSQAGLNREERLKNVRNVFRVINSKTDKAKIPILIDDITTTGATLENAAMTLKKIGFKRVYAIVLSKGTK